MKSNLLKRMAIGGLLIGAVAFGGGVTSGCAMPGSKGGFNWNDLDNVVRLKKELRNDNNLNKVNDVGEYYLILRNELGTKQSNGELSKDMNVIDYYRLKQKQSQYKQELKAREDALKAQESKKSY